MSPSVRVLRPANLQILQSSRAQKISLKFLAPSLLQSQASFSTSASHQYPRDHNRQRGVSTVRRTGPRHPLSVSNKPLPKPVLDPKKRSKYPVDENHGLWGFFHAKDKPMNTPEEDYDHGRPWSVEELRHKSWEDLHALWWVCAKERNRIATEAYERDRLGAGYGAHEAVGRDYDVRSTQRAIKHVLTERWYSWDEARKLARNDPEIDLSGKGPAYVPGDNEQLENFEEEEYLEENELEEDVEKDEQNSVSKTANTPMTSANNATSPAL